MGTNLRGEWSVAPLAKETLARRNPDSLEHAPGDRAATEAAMAELQAPLLDLQRRLWAEGRRSLLVVLQGIDTSGKDGTISRVFRGLNPLGMRVVSFREPSREELAHDFLWRVHPHSPAVGEIAIFNRSHYEDVLTVRVHGSVPPEVWQPRYAHINAFESVMHDAGTTIVKVFLHISKTEQRKRLDQRLADPEKAWKVAESDFADRELWQDYIGAFDEMFEKTSTDIAPWYVVPADHKWYRSWAVSNLLLETLEEMDPQAARGPQP
jgi:PPK2 family polyphosphate:nucleotide phosphotransferase